jgi:hypothetical protein
VAKPGAKKPAKAGAGKAKRPPAAARKKKG